MGGRESGAFLKYSVDKADIVQSFESFTLLHLKALFENLKWYIFLLGQENIITANLPFFGGEGEGKGSNCNNTSRAN